MLPSKSQTTAYLSEHFNECADLAQSALEEIEKLRTCPKEDRTQVAASAFSLLKEADDNLQSLQMAARSATGERKEQIAKDEKAVRAELKAAAQLLQDVRRQLLLDANESGGDTDKLFKAREDRRRSEAVTANLKRSQEVLEQSRRQAAEAEQMGVDTLMELRRQREVMHNIKQHTEDAGYANKMADRHLKEMEQNQCSVM